MARTIDSVAGTGKPVWLIEQSFGGEERWRREPSARDPDDDQKHDPEENYRF